MHLVCRILDHKKSLLDARLVSHSQSHPYIRVRLGCKRCGQLLEPARIFDLTEKEVADFQRNMLEKWTPR